MGGRAKTFALAQEGNSSFNPDRFTAEAHFDLSARMKALKSEGALPTGSPP